MECVVLTYNVKHRKTYDTLCRLKASGIKDVLVYAVPMHYKKTYFPLFEHRPCVNNDLSNKEICKNFDYEYFESIMGYENLRIDKNVPILLCGAGIIPKEIVMKYKIINSHPGYIPYVRGLDAIKWALYENLPIGVTSHLLGDEIDAGEIIEREIVNVYNNDTFHSIAYRVYDKEIDLLVRALEKYDGNTEYISGGDNVIHKRMDKKTEQELFENIDSIIKERSK